MTVAAVVAAAGRGERLGADVPKALRSVRGEPLLVHAVRCLQAHRELASVVVAAPAAALEQVEAALSSGGLRPDWAVVAGADNRLASVARALTALPAGVEIVLVHDAARCVVPVGVVERVVAAVRSGADAVVPVVPVDDTVKRVDAMQVTATVDRAPLRRVQTPQGFRRSVLEQAYAAAGSTVLTAHTDDAGLVERLGVAVQVVPGHAEAFKVTSPLDLLLAEAVLGARGRH